LDTLASGSGLASNSSLGWHCRKVRLCRRQFGIMAIIRRATWLLSLPREAMSGRDDEGAVDCGGFSCSRRNEWRADSKLPHANDDSDRAVRARRTGRRYRPHRRRHFRSLSRAAVCSREGRRCRWHDRIAPRGACRCRRLYDHFRSNGYARRRPVFYPNLGYDPETDFEPIGLIAEQPELLAVRKDFPANNLKEFIAYAKANESKLNMGHAGVGSVSYVGCLLLNSAIGIKPAMVPFTGTAPVMNAILAGQVDYDCDPVLGPLPHVRAGTVKALAIATKRRSPLLPDVLTSHEQGLPEFDCAPFYALFAPKGT